MCKHVYKKVQLLVSIYFIFIIILFLLVLVCYNLEYASKLFVKT